ncbi:MAG: sugar phosphate nucleotidyltransferase [Candidatus Promineifilaceae bacterium]|jgi:UTP--glucose-1-phosphate uridylyltransferase
MEVTKAVITAAGRGQRTLPLQSLIDSDGTEKSVLCILIEEVIRAGVEEICFVVRPGDEDSFAKEAEKYGGRIFFVHQAEPLGHGHAVYCAREFVGSRAFLHLVGDHLYVSSSEDGCAERLVHVAEKEACSVSTVQATRESFLPYYGAVGGHRMRDRGDIYRIETVIEKPTPTLAEQRLVVPGLRAGHYLCFFGTHVLTSKVFDILEELIGAAGNQTVTLAEALDVLSNRERYLALEMPDRRYDIGVPYGLMTAQLALALSGKDRDLVLNRLLELLASRELSKNRE